MPMHIAETAKNIVSHDFFDMDDAESLLRHSFWGLHLMFEAAVKGHVLFHSPSRLDLLSDPVPFEISRAASEKTLASPLRSVHWEISGLAHMPRHGNYPLTKTETTAAEGPVRIKGKFKQASGTIFQHTPHDIQASADFMVWDFFETATQFLARPQQNILYKYMHKNGILIPHAPVAH